MNVINFSGGGPQTDPANDAMYEAIHNTALAGVVPVIAAGNDREDFGSARPARPGAAPDAITVAATSELARLRPRPDGGRRPAVTRRRSDPERGRREASRAWSTLNQTVVDVSFDRRHRRQAGRPAPLRLDDRPEHDARDAAERTPSRGRSSSSRAASAPSSRRPKRAEIGGRDRDHPRRQPLRRGEPDPDSARRSPPG